MCASKWNVEPWILELRLAERFTISRGSWDRAQNVFATVSWDGVKGFGEVSADDPQAVLEQLGDVDLEPLAGPYDLEGLAELLPPGPVRCVLDIALHDLAGKLAGRSLSELLGVAGRTPPPTSVTVPIADVDQMIERARRLSRHPALKIKVGFDGDVDAVSAVRDVYDGRIRIDANEGWDVDTAIERLQSLERCDVELCEQPVAADDVEGLRKVARATPIPVFADEAARTSRDVALLADAVDGVNLKLRKAGGIRETVKAVATARALGLGVMLGCDLESGVAASAQAHVAALVDHADIDGPLLLAEDPFPGVTYSEGVFERPTRPGLGLSKEPS